MVAPPPTSPFTQVHDGSSSVATVEGLDPGRLYWVRASLTNACGTGPASRPVPVVTKPTRPVPPRKPRCQVSGPVSVPTLFRVLRGELASPLGGGDAKQAGRASLVSGVLSQAVEACASGHDCAARCIVVHWDPVPTDTGAPVTEYRLQMQVTPPPGTATSEPPLLAAGRDFVTVYQGAANGAVVAHPVPGAKYSFRVAAANHAGVGKPSSVASCRCDGYAPGPVQHVTATDVRVNSLKVVWDAPDTNGGTLTG